VDIPLLMQSVNVGNVLPVLRQVCP
jgi:hypothetical protein